MHGLQAMFLNPFKQIANSSDAVLREQYAHLRTQIPLMYALIFINAAFLGLVTYGEVSIGLSLGFPAVLSLVIVVRGVMWLVRNAKEVEPARIRRYLHSTLWMSVILSMAVGGWGLILLNNADPVRSTSIALYVFVASISCCYCLQAIPLAGWFVVIFGAMPVTLHLLISDDPYLAGIGVTFILVAGLILRTLATSHEAFQDALHIRSEMGKLIEALQQSEEHYRYSVELNPQIPWTSDASGAVLELSPRWATLTGLSVGESLGSGWLAAVHPEDVPRVQKMWREAVETGGDEIADIRYRLRLRDGSYRCFRARARPRLDADGSVITWYGNLEDIEDQMVAERALQESEERYRLASQASNDIIWDVSLGTDLIEWSGAAAAILGHPEMSNGTSRKWLLERVHPDDRAEVISRFSRMDDPDLTHWTQEFRFRRVDGEHLMLRARGYVVRDETGQPVRLIGSLQDVTAQKRYEDKLLWAAHYDSLTLLPNRVLFADRLDSALADARKNGTYVGLVVLDVDRFKTINDSLGHDTGDAMLCEIAARLRHQTPASATVARLGGDEFAIIFPGLDSSTAKTETIEQLLADVSHPMFYAGRQIEVSLSAGAAVAFSDGLTSEELHKSADLALYSAKSQGIGQVCGFSRDLRDAAEREKEMLSDARSALQDDRIVPFYQPKICLRTGKLAGFEALLRWHHNEQGLLAPAAIDAAFQDPGISVQLTDRMLDRAIGDMVGWHDRGLVFGRVAINGSPEDFRRGDFADRILDRLHRAGLPTSLMELEVTETVFLGQLAANVSTALDILSEAGVTIALDDFGTGYASLTHLKQFPVNTLKIDRSFVSRLGVVETDDAAIVGAVIDLAKSLGIDTVAEGIETQAQATHLLVKGCDVGQGFLFGRPMAAAQVAQSISDWDATTVLGLCSAQDWAQATRQSHRERFS